MLFEDVCCPVRLKHYAFFVFLLMYNHSLVFSSFNGQLFVILWTAILGPQTQKQNMKPRGHNVHPDVHCPSWVKTCTPKMVGLLRLRGQMGRLLLLPIEVRNDICDSSDFQLSVRRRKRRCQTISKNGQRTWQVWNVSRRSFQLNWNEEICKLKNETFSGYLRHI